MKDQPVSSLRHWTAISLGTVVLLLSFWSIAFAFVFGAVEGDIPLAWFAFGLALVPLVFVILALVSRHPSPGLAVFKAMGLALLVGIPLLVLIGDPVSGVVAGYGAGGVAALRRSPDRPWTDRAFAVAAAVVVTAVLIRTVSGLGLILAPAFPLTSLGLADALRSRAQPDT